MIDRMYIKIILSKKPMRIYGWKAILKDEADANYSLSQFRFIGF